MIYEVKEYWVADGATPKEEDIKNAISAARKKKCTIRLNWKGPGWRWHGDTYHVEISKDDDVNEIMESLPKIYGL